MFLADVDVVAVAAVRIVTVVIETVDMVDAVVAVVMVVVVGIVVRLPLQRRLFFGRVFLAPETAPRRPRPPRLSPHADQHQHQHQG